MEKFRARREQTLKDFDSYVQNLTGRARKSFFGLKTGFGSHFLANRPGQM
jgi:hypothetical protein